MDCITVLEARYIQDHRIWIRFNTGESGEADLRDIVFKFPIAASLREPAEFAKFHLDEWPTLTWECGFDLDPEYLYEIVTGKVSPESLIKVLTP
jgi:hypothetical protein